MVPLLRFGRVRATEMMSSGTGFFLFNKFVAFVAWAEFRLNF
jgi:hypothetical protein